MKIKNILITMATAALVAGCSNNTALEGSPTSGQSTVAPTLGQQQSTPTEQDKSTESADSIPSIDTEKEKANRDRIDSFAREVLRHRADSKGINLSVSSFEHRFYSEVAHVTYMNTFDSKEGVPVTEGIDPANGVELRLAGDPDNLKWAQISLESNNENGEVQLGALAVFVQQTMPDLDKKKVNEWLLSALKDLKTNSMPTKFKHNDNELRVYREEGKISVIVMNYVKPPQL